MEQAVRLAWGLGGCGRAWGYRQVAESGEGVLAEEWETLWHSCRMSLEPPYLKT